MTAWILYFEVFLKQKNWTHTQWQGVCFEIFSQKSRKFFLCWNYHFLIDLLQKSTRHINSSSSWWMNEWIEKAKRTENKNTKFYYCKWKRRVLSNQMEKRTSEERKKCFYLNKLNGVAMIFYDCFPCSIKFSFVSFLSASLHLIVRFNERFHEFIISGKTTATEYCN